MAKERTQKEWDLLIIKQAKALVRIIHKSKRSLYCTESIDGVNINIFKHSNTIRIENIIAGWQLSAIPFKL